MTSRFVTNLKGYVGWVSGVRSATSRRSATVVFKLPVAMLID